MNEEINTINTNTFPPCSTQADTFEHILEVTNHQEALYAYYWMDDDQKMKLTEIFDITNKLEPHIKQSIEQSDWPDSESDWETNVNGEF